MMRETLTVGSSMTHQWGRAGAVKDGRSLVGIGRTTNSKQTTTMSEAQEETTAKRMSKDVQIVAYLKADPSEGVRWAMDGLDDGSDYFSTSVSTRDYYRMAFDGTDKKLDEDEYQYLKDKDPAGMRLMHYVKESEDYDNSEYDFKRTFRRSVLGDVDMVMPGSDMEKWLANTVKINGRTVFTVKASKPEKMGLLKHQSEASSGDMWEDREDERWAVTVNCEVDGLKPSLYRWFDETVVPSIMQEVAKHEWVSQTRVMDCEKEYSESGVCFDL